MVVAFEASTSSDNLGRITFGNFKDLMCSLKAWHNVFKTWTKEKSGILKSERLREALLDVGFQVNTPILSALMFRYIRKDGTLRFGDFVAIVLSLSVAFGEISIFLANWREKKPCQLSVILSKNMALDGVSTYFLEN